MKAKLPIALLMLCACAALAEEKEFQDPFATEDAAAQPKISDPLERVNRAIFHFNDKLYCWVLRPISKGYRTVAPKPVRDSVERLFDNVKYPARVVNNVLEGRFKGAGIETTRFVVNSTVGIGGLFDPATRWNLKKQPADFDQTLAVYRIPTGMYLNLPVLGPSSLRGAVGVVGDAALNPVRYLDTEWALGLAGGNIVNAASLHGEEYESLKEATLDPYVALRSAYFENRANAVKRSGD